MDTMTRIAELTADLIAKVWPETEGLPGAAELRNLLAVPPDPAMGDYAFPCFRLAKPLRSAPPKIAEALCNAWTETGIASVQPVNGYMNFFLNRANFAEETMKVHLFLLQKKSLIQLHQEAVELVVYHKLN